VGGGGKVGRKWGCMETDAGFLYAFRQSGSGSRHGEKRTIAKRVGKENIAIKDEEGNV